MVKRKEVNGYVKRIDFSLMFIGCVLMVSPVLHFAGEMTLVDGIVNTVKDTGGNITAVYLNLSIQGEKVVQIVL